MLNPSIDWLGLWALYPPGPGQCNATSQDSSYRFYHINQSTTCLVYIQTFHFQDIQDHVLYITSRSPSQRPLNSFNPTHLSTNSKLSYQAFRCWQTSNLSICQIAVHEAVAMIVAVQVPPAGRRASNVSRVGRVFIYYRVWTVEESTSDCQNS